MATFVKLTNGDVVNTQHIKSIKRHKEIEPGAFREALQKGSRDSETGEYRIVSAPAIQLLLGSDPSPLTLKYESDQQRDAEFERIETILSGPRPMVTFGNRTFDLAQIQSMSVDWEGYHGTHLELRIKIPGLRVFMVTINKDKQEDWEKCLSLLAHFNMELPPVPTWDL